MTPKARTAAAAAGVVVLMASLSFAAVPFYNWFCRVTGFGGATGIGVAGDVAPVDETITVRFDASLDRGMPWTFRPVEREMVVRLGETNLAFYEATNPTSRPVAGQASYNVAPYAAGGYFTKIECFCFQEQVLQPGETVQMPVSFYVDPAILEDPEGAYVREITLGYTFYEIDLPPDDPGAEPVPDGERAALAPLTTPDAGSID
jgi:cytochrome c oxidase assembly protein subunit 11